MTVDRFPAALAFTLRPDCDGQPYHVTPGDPGGATAWGVTQRTYDAYRAGRRLATRSVAAMDQQECAALYRSQFWQPVRGDDLPPGVSLAVFDFGVTAGARASARILQQCIGVEADGIIGQHTLQETACWSPAGLVARLCDAQADYYRGLANFYLFGRGWLNRTESRRRAAAAALVA
jgi:lysozyme family protein